MHGIWYLSNRDNISGTVTRTQAGKPRNYGSIPGRDKRLHKCLEQLWGPANLLFNREQGALSPWAKWLGHEADHSPQSNAI